MKHTPKFSMSTHNTKSIPLPISSLQILVPDLNVRRWTSRGITTVEDIKISPSIKTFRAIQIDHGLESMALYTDNQIAHLLLVIPTPYVSISNKIFLYLTNPVTSIKGISLFYNFLNQKSELSKIPSMKTWELDLMSSYSIEQWQNSLKITYVCTKCVNLLLRWYLKPTRIAGFHSQTSPLCWRQCGHRGSLMHILWACPSLKTFWSHVFDLKRKLTDTPLPKNPELAILSLGIESPTSPKKHSLSSPCEC